jgi:hypothetical protein
MQSGNGNACTCVVTEYHYLSLEHGYNYRIDVEYMTSEEIQELLSELLHSFRAFDAEGMQVTQSIEELEEIRKRAMNAKETLIGLFRNHTEITPLFLSDPSPGAQESILMNLNTLAKDLALQRPGSPDCLTWSTTAETVDDVVDALIPFTRDPIDSGTPLLWPFVRIVRYEHN